MMTDMICSWLQWCFRSLSLTEHIILSTWCTKLNTCSLCTRHPFINWPWIDNFHIFCLVRLHWSMQRSANSAHFGRELIYFSPYLSSHSTRMIRVSKVLLYFSWISKICFTQFWQPDSLTLSRVIYFTLLSFTSKRGILRIKGRSGRRRLTLLWYA